MFGMANFFFPLDEVVIGDVVPLVASLSLYET